MARFGCALALVVVMYRMREMSRDTPKIFKLSEDLKVSEDLTLSRNLTLSEELDALDEADSVEGGTLDLDEKLDPVRDHWHLANLDRDPVMMLEVGPWNMLAGVWNGFAAAGDNVLEETLLCKKVGSNVGECGPVCGVGASGESDRWCVQGKTCVLSYPYMLREMLKNNEGSETKPSYPNRKYGMSTTFYYGVVLDGKKGLGDETTTHCAGESDHQFFDLLLQRYREIVPKDVKEASGRIKEAVTVTFKRYYSCDKAAIASRATGLSTGKQRFCRPDEKSTFFCHIIQRNNRVVASEKSPPQESGTEFQFPCMNRFRIDQFQVQFQIITLLVFFQGVGK